MHNLELVQMAHAKDKRPAEISGGMKQRVGIARALAMEPKVLLLDEPFGALDALTRAHLQDSVMAIHQKLGNTVLMITHDVDEAVLLSDRIVMMTNGPAARIGEVLEVPTAAAAQAPRAGRRPDLHPGCRAARARVPLRAPQGARAASRRVGGRASDGPRHGTASACWSRCGQRRWRRLERLLVVWRRHGGAQAGRGALEQSRPLRIRSPGRNRTAYNRVLLSRLLAGEVADDDIGCGRPPGTPSNGI